MVDYGGGGYGEGTYGGFPTLTITATAYPPVWHIEHPAPLVDIEIVAIAPTWRVTYGDSLSMEPLGFEVRVLEAIDYTTVLAVITDWSALTFAPELSDTGNGSITMDLDSPFWLTSLPGKNDVLHYDGMSLPGGSVSQLAGSPGPTLTPKSAAPNPIKTSDGVTFPSNAELLVETPSALTSFSFAGGFDLTYVGIIVDSTANDLLEISNFAGPGDMALTLFWDSPNISGGVSGGVDDAYWEDYWEFPVSVDYGEEFTFRYLVNSDGTSKIWWNGILVRDSVVTGTVGTITGSFVEIPLGAVSDSFVFKTLSVSSALSVGPDALYILQDEHLWEVWEAGKLRFQFFGKIIQEQIVEETGGRAVTVTGPGTGEVLNWGVVFPDEYDPDAGTASIVPRVFNPVDGGGPIVSVMAVFLQLLHEAQDRGTCTMVDPQFDENVDSYDEDWPDIDTAGVFSPKLSDTLMTVLQDVAGADDYTTTDMTVDWVMRPYFKLDAAPVIGTHRENDIIFYDNNVTKTRERTRSRQKIKNYVVAMDDTGALALQVEDPSIARWDQREQLVLVGNNLTADKDAIAQAYLDLLMDEKSEWTINVQYGVKGRMPFEDFDLGDWIGVEEYIPVGVDPRTSIASGGSSTISAYRVLAIVIHINSDGEVEMELTLQNKFTTWEKKIERQLAKLLAVIAQPPIIEEPIVEP